MKKNLLNKKSFVKIAAFTLAEVLITLGIIGVIAALTIPALMQGTSNKELVAGVLKFSSTLSQAIQSWKQDISCDLDARTCLRNQNLPDDTIANFDQIAKFMKISKRIGSGANTESWLPTNINKYNGSVADTEYGNLSQFGVSSGAFLLEDGSTFSIDVDSAGFAILADVNGKKGPNRIGKDIFFFTVGEYAGSDIYYYPYWWNNSDGLCSVTSNPPNCDANNIDPSVGSGASPTAYVVLNQKIPNFEFPPGGGGGPLPDPGDGDAQAVQPPQNQ